MLEEISYREALEWELFDRQNPDQLDTISIQIGQIAVFFANAFAPKKDKTSWEIERFLPTFNKKKSISKPEKKAQAQIADQAFSIAAVYGDPKAKKIASKKLNEGVIGTDGKRYKYALEERVPERKTLPKRLRG